MIRNFKLYQSDLETGKGLWIHFRNYDRAFAILEKMAIDHPETTFILEYELPKPKFKFTLFEYIPLSTHVFIHDFSDEAKALVAWRECADLEPKKIFGIVKVPS